MEESLDFLNYKSIIRYLIVFGIILGAGAVLKDFAAILISCIILYYLFRKKYFLVISLWLMWLLCAEFYISEGFINFQFVSKYIAKPNFLLFCIFLFTYNKVPDYLKNSAFTKLFFIFLVIVTISAIIHKQSPFSGINAAPFFLAYFICRGLKLEDRNIVSLYNLFIAAAILQVVISLLEVSAIIPPPAKMMDDGTGAVYKWEGSIDDVASGTFGAANSHITAWFSALVALFLFITFAINRKIKYIVFCGLILTEFALNDSKTVLGVTIMMFGYLILVYLLTRQKSFKLNIAKLILILSVLCVVGILLAKGINAYYVYYGNETGSKTRTDLSTVYSTEVTSSSSIVLENPTMWGKIRGYQYIFEDFYDEGMLTLMFGYGWQGYVISGKMGYIENQDPPNFQTDNFTNSRSALITEFAKNGVLGFMFLILSVVSWFYFSNFKEVTGKIELLNNAIVKVFLIFSALGAFVYSIDIPSITLVAFGSLIGLNFNYSEGKSDA